MIGVTETNLIHRCNMSELIQLSPEVSGGWGPGTVVSNNTASHRPPRAASIAHLDYEFADWQGDALLTTAPCFIVDERLAKRIRDAKLTGVEFDEIVVSFSDTFSQLNPTRPEPFPRFVRLVPLGQVTLPRQPLALNWTGHDFCEGSTGHLVVSLAAWEVLNSFPLAQCRARRLTVA